MLAKLLGWLFIIAGILFLLKPQMLRKRFQKKSLKALKKYLFVIVMFLSILFITAALRTSGILSKILLVLGIVGIFKGFFFLKAKIAGRIIEWYGKQSLAFFRFFASLYILSGLIILWLRK
jgi:uncharacterized protein YjeT (DUF2065 family)